MTEEIQPIYLKDYKEPDYLINTVKLEFELAPEATKVISVLSVSRNKKHKRPLVLDGEDLKLKLLELDGVEVLSVNEHGGLDYPVKPGNDGANKPGNDGANKPGNDGANKPGNDGANKPGNDGASKPGNDEQTSGVALISYKISDHSLEIFNVPVAFELKIIVEIAPQNNTMLEGLYLSKGIFCTQCEAMGFRRITYFLDRPDVLSRFSTTIKAPRSCPILLSNGNLVAQGECEEPDYHWATWDDPTLKPCYLFALVAGDLAHIEDKFVSCSGKEILLQVYSEHGYESKCEYALASLKRAMRWDEEVFGFEYDLKNYMIVAISDFNVGAMENKGLNLFNSKYVFADSNTATDDDYVAVENVVAHEYFHNWTGNNVTCRDWFQITLKEGLTMFRDQLFTGDMTSHAVQRIKDVNVIRSVQFKEDAGPMAHPPQPDSYIEMNNFYTATVYNKGAELIRMLYTILGKERFFKGITLYVKACLGRAATIDDFVAAMAAAGKLSLAQFKKWYHEAGTPTVTVRSSYDKAAKTCTITIEQDRELHVPFELGLIADDGTDIVSEVLQLHKKREKFIFSGIDSKPYLSLLRNFSAPVKLNYNYSREELLFLMAHDSDPFNRWNATQQLGVTVIFELLAAVQQSKQPSISREIIDAYHQVLVNNDIDDLLRVELLTLPTMGYLIESCEVADVLSIFKAREFLRTSLARELKVDFLKCYNLTAPDTVGERALRNLALSYLLLLADTEMDELAVAQLYNAANMTEMLGALQPLVNRDVPEREKALQFFYERFKDQPLVVDKWLSVQAISTLPDTLDSVVKLANSQLFDPTNPNKIYALIRNFAQNNQVRFHDEQGLGYQFLADQVLLVDSLNPQVAARIVTPLIHWRKFPETAQTLMKEQLARILATENLSKNVYEVVSRGLM